MNFPQKHNRWFWEEKSFDWFFDCAREVRNHRQNYDVNQMKRNRIYRRNLDLNFRKITFLFIIRKLYSSLSRQLSLKIQFVNVVNNSIRTAWWDPLNFENFLSLRSWSTPKNDVFTTTDRLIIYATRVKKKEKKPYRKVTSEKLASTCTSSEKCIPFFFPKKRFVASNVCPVNDSRAQIQKYAKLACLGLIIHRLDFVLRASIRLCTWFIMEKKKDPVHMLNLVSRIIDKRASKFYFRREKCRWTRQTERACVCVFDLLVGV